MAMPAPDFSLCLFLIPERVVNLSLSLSLSLILHIFPFSYAFCHQYHMVYDPAMDFSQKFWPSRYIMCVCVCEREREREREIEVMYK
jgi:hypothetical protein